ncbi:MAG: hypothetical protein A3G24_21890 [Betaproteobacteria bacterium RIFCSPLOWO2_12_FULL_62_13]|nr:MAG: hypothetical protein A3G24_21890 [Betaproteobacteria bacterium RIFCSPLOWO2_12_FULL_62_13]
MKAKRSVAMAATLAVVAGVAWFVWCGFSTPALPEGILEGHGRIEAIEVAIAGRVPGRIVEMPVREGDRVNKADLLALLSAEELDHRLAQARARTASAEALLRMREEETQATEREAEARLAAARERLQQAQERIQTLAHHADRVRADHQRNRDLVSKSFISERQLASSENALRQSEGELAEARRLEAAARAEVEAARASRDGIAHRSPALLKSLAEEAAAARAAHQEIAVSRAELRVVAPLTGTVVTKAAEAGELASPGRPLLVLADLGRPYLRVYIPERDIGKVKLGDPARVYVDSFPNRPFEAVVTEVAKKAEFTPKDVHMPDERVTLVYSVKLEIRNPQGVLKPGMPADALIRWKPEAPWGK